MFLVIDLVIEGKLGFILGVMIDDVVYYEYLQVLYFEVRVKFVKIVDEYQVMIVVFFNGYIVEFRVYDNGVVYWFVIDFE